MTAHGSISVKPLKRERVVSDVPTLRNLNVKVSRRT